MQVDMRAREVRIDGQPVPLTPKECLIVEALAEHPDETFEKNALVRKVWGEQYSEVDLATYVRHIREKIEPDPSKPRYLKTAWGVGYLLARP